MPEPTTELLDSVSYHKHEYAKIDATGWSFEKNDGNGGMLPWLIALILAAGIVVMLHIKRVTASPPTPLLKNTLKAEMQGQMQLLPSPIGEEVRLPSLSVRRRWSTHILPTRISMLG